ncbi:tryptophan--tRNA ligase [Bacteroidetes/Chlorobi group bacterium MS-B_bin-24]|jgi:tryptophanyl-tRNA synthetase|nr:MAG: tryptophan--tRNA ligase [Bacteroidetes/Chlorobi group bacterium MS-B_bin-24]
MEGEQKRKVILSGMQPTGGLHIGHLTGALRNWVEFQSEFECYYTIVDLHAITVRQEPAKLRQWTLDLAATFIAAGINPEQAHIFVQSHVPEHTQLAWVLNCFTGMGECSRMTQFKDKSQKYPENVNVGLFAYPVLMAADILLYQADLIPVGADQKQHLELTRNLAERFNNLYSPTFKVPEPYIPKIGAKIMNLQNPTKKMSKTDEAQLGVLYLTDTPEQIKNKINRAVTDSGSEIKFSDTKPGISNLITLYHIATGKSIEQIEQEFAGRGYGEFKKAVGEALVEFLEPFRNRYKELRAEEGYLFDVLRKGAEQARVVAQKTLRKVYKKIGFVML